MSDLVFQLDADKFEQDVLKSDKPVVVEIVADDCPPCQALAPIFSKMAETYSDRVKFVKLLRHHNREFVDSLRIKSMPTVMFFLNGEETCERLMGYISEPELKDMIEKAITGECGKTDRRRYECDALILGGGPAGLTSAIYLSRAKLKTVVLETAVPGGQASTTFHISNYPGTPGTVRGSELMQNMLEQAMSFGALIDDLQDIAKVDLHGVLKHVKTENTDYYAKSVIICTGAEPRKLPAEGEEKYRSRGVHYCATCDGAFYQDRKLVVVGGGNSAVEEAVFLTRFASHVTVIHQFDHFQASKVAQDELFSNEKIDVIWNSEVQSVKGNDMVQEVEIKNTVTGEVHSIPTDGVFVYIGTQPRTDFFKGQIQLNGKGYIITDEDMKTNIEGVFAAGDVRDKKVRQVATAVGDGATAAFMAEKYISEMNVQALGVH